MGTRSTIKFYSEFNDDTVIASIYKQFDGYIDCVGHELANFLKDKKVINGISGQLMEDGFANGMGCLAAQFIAENKNAIGGFYMTNENDEQEYNYKVKLLNDKLIIEVDDFIGTPEELLNYKED